MFGVEGGEIYLLRRFLFLLPLFGFLGGDFFFVSWVRGLMFFRLLLLFFWVCACEVCGVSVIGVSVRGVLAGLLACPFEDLTDVTEDVVSASEKDPSSIEDSTSSRLVFLESTDGVAA